LTLSTLETQWGKNARQCGEPTHFNCNPCYFEAITQIDQPRSYFACHRIFL
jgi:hypothetical protein